MALESTPQQTIGPFHAVLLPLGGSELVPPGTPGAVTIEGAVFDGAGAPVPDAAIEIWQANPEGIYAHPDDPRWKADEPSAAFQRGSSGWGRCLTGLQGEYSFVTVKPGRVRGFDERMQAPHIVVSVFARGLLKHLVTRIYFPDEAAANATDPLLTSIEDESVRRTLIAQPSGANRFRFDIRLQGEGETAFLAV